MVHQGSQYLVAVIVSDRTHHFFQRGEAIPHSCENRHVGVQITVRLCCFQPSDMHFRRVALPPFQGRNEMGALISSDLLSGVVNVPGAFAPQVGWVEPEAWPYTSASSKAPSSCEFLHAESGVSKRVEKGAPTEDPSPSSKRPRTKEDERGHNLHASKIPFASSW
jgi:hypothetical protein